MQYRTLIAAFERYISKISGLLSVKKAPLLSLIVGAMLLSGFANVNAEPVKGPYVEQVQFIHLENENVALEQVKSGEIDAYYFRIPLEVASDTQNDPRIKIYERRAGSNTMLVNPAPSKDENVLNPFQFQGVRFALNYLIDRDLAVNEFRKGFGSPLADPYGIYSPEYPDIIGTVESFGFRNNPQLAEKLISDTLSAAGATKEDGKWIYKDKPVSVRVLIRSDDVTRKLIGDDLASKLEGIGFTVEKDYGDLIKANTLVYGSDPQALQWHIYTEGFAGTSTFVKQNPVIPAQMYAPWFGRMPGGQNPGFWNYQNATLDEVTQRIYFANFTSREERTELLNSAVKMGIQESVRIFVSQNTDPFAASPTLQGIVNDFGAGITSKFSLINARPADGDSLTVGVKQIHQGAWNNVGGLQDIYSRDIYFLVVDSGDFHHPYTGEIIPVRVQWDDIETKGPLGKLSVDPAAIVWDPVSQQWKQVGSDVTSLSRVSYKMLYSNWHHGIPMDKADLMYSLYFTFEWGTNLGENDLTVDPEYTPQAEPLLPLLKGFQFTDDGLESYIDQWHYDEKEIADAGMIWASEPWEISAAVERLVTAGKIAYSRSEASINNVGWLDMVVPEHADMIKEELQQMKNEGYVPAPLRDIVSVDEANKRYDASINWIGNHHHAVIGNGPFYFDSYNISGRTITIKAFHDPTYPFEQGYWSSFGTPKLAKILSIDAPRTMTAGQPVSAKVVLQVDGQPSSDASVNYFLSNKDGKLIISGDATPTEETGMFLIDIPASETSKLSMGPNRLKIFANSNAAFSPDYSTSTILVITGSTMVQKPADNTPDKVSAGPSGCLIATAAFGSELSPQVEYLRSFRQNYILSTTSGSAFMNAFNTVYYSFSPQVADYERQQPWLQSAVKAGLYPLFGILHLSERAHFAFSGSEAGAVAAGATASMLIGAVYLWPAALAGPVRRRFASASKLALFVAGASICLVTVGVAANNTILLSVSTSLFVLSVASLSALASGRMISKLAGLARRTRYR